MVKMQYNFDSNHSHCDRRHIHESWFISRALVNGESKDNPAIKFVNWDPCRSFLRRRLISIYTSALKLKVWTKKPFGAFDNYKLI